MKFANLLSLAWLVASAFARIPRDYEHNDYYVLHLDENTEPRHVAERLGLVHESHLGELTDHHVFRAAKAEHDMVKREISERKRRKRDLGDHDVLDGVLLSAKQNARMRLEKRVVPPLPKGWYPRPRSVTKPDKAAALRQSQVMKALNIVDPMFTDQWHLFNPVQVGHDVNVTQVWLDGITGMNTTVAIVDDGLDMHSNDLKNNYFAEGSYDFNDDDPEPAPELAEDRHGTRCAGEVGAGRNNVCGVGVAYDSRIAGIRILSKPITDADEAEALMYKFHDNQIYSCSWGPPDDGRSMEAPDTLIKRAMLKSIQEGRDGLGNIYVFASGNGAASGDNCNFDGYTNSIYSITVGAVDRFGQHPAYSEHCCAQLVVTYSSGGGDAIHTTDVGPNACVNTHGGTSAAAPLAAGIFALVLQTRPELTWRDMQYLAMETAALVDSNEADWVETTIGKQFSHTFGYGKIDSYAMVEKAKTWELVKPQAWLFSPWLHVKKDIPQGEEGLVATFEVTEKMLKDANMARLEHVTVTMNVNHTRRGDLSVDLISPDKMISHLSTARPNDEFEGGYDDWTFMSVAHWGESGVGKWSIIVRDTEENKHRGKFIDWHLKLWGEAIDADKATLLPMPTDEDDDDHDVYVSTATSPASTSSVGAGHRPTVSSNIPSDHPARPTKPTEPEQEVAQEPTQSPSSNWISWLPSFGASKKAQMWIYGAIGLIAAFCIGLGIYFWIARRRRLRNSIPRDNYDFELLDEEEVEGLNSGEKNGGGGGAGGRRSRRTRGGELYDAFAGGSDDEEFADYSDRSAVRSTERLPHDDGDQYVIGGESDDDDDDRSIGRGPTRSPPPVG